MASSESNHLLGLLLQFFSVSRLDRIVSKGYSEEETMIRLHSYLKEDYYTSFSHPPDKEDFAAISREFSVLLHYSMELITALETKPETASAKAWIGVATRIANWNEFTKNNNIVHIGNFSWTDYLSSNSVTLGNFFKSVIFVQKAIEYLIANFKFKLVDFVGLALLGITGELEERIKYITDTPIYDIFEKFDWAKTPEKFSYWASVFLDKDIEYARSSFLNSAAQYDLNLSKVKLKPKKKIIDTFVDFNIIDGRIVPAAHLT